MSRVVQGKTFTDRVSRMAAVAGSQRRLASVIGVSAPTVIGWMNGSEPYESTYRKIEEATGVSMEWLRDGRGDEDAELRRFSEKLLAGKDAFSGSEYVREDGPPLAGSPQHMEHFLPSDLDSGLSRVVDLFAAHTDPSQLSEVLDDLLATREIPAGLRLRLSNRIDHHIKLHRSHSKRPHGKS